MNIYNINIIPMNKVSEFLSNWIRSPTGPKTTHFWAPLMNWFFPIQALYDWNRNPENISRGMQGVLVGIVFKILFN